jgi:hypothetical protein
MIPSKNPNWFERIALTVGVIAALCSILGFLVDHVSLH